MSKETENSHLGEQMQGIMPRCDDGVGPMTGRRLSADATSDDEDAALVRRCRRGDVAAFGLLVSRHESRVRALVGRILGAGATPMMWTM